MKRERQMSEPVRKNVYLCHDCGAGWCSADMAIGVTPFMDRCPFCKTGMGRSFMYRVPQELLADVPARVEWFKPTEAEIAAMSPAGQDHVRKGGLARRFVSQVQ